MKKMFSLLMVLAMVCVSAAYAQEASVVPEEKDWSVSLTLKYANKYMTDGFILTDGDMLFPDLTVSYKGFFAEIWGAMDLNNKNNQNVDDGTYGNVGKGNFEEVDFIFGYDYTFKDLAANNSLSIHAQWAYYKYPQRWGAWDADGKFRRASDGTTQKISIDLTTGLFLNPGVNLDWAYEEKAWMLTFHAEHSQPLAVISEKLTFDNRAEILAGNRFANWVTSYVSENGRKGFGSFIWTTSLNYACCDNVSFGPFAKMIWHLDNCVREGAAIDGNNHKFDTVLGAQISANF